MSASAKGLFRATGKTRKPVAVRLLDGTYTKDPEGLEREPDDFYPTPPEPIRSFLAAELPRLRMFGRVWDGSCGDNALVREMRAVGLETHSSDLIDRGVGAEIRDFYDFQEAPARASVQNPPFGECNWRPNRARWVRHALETLDLDYLALLLNWTWPGAAGTASLLDDYPISRVYLMRWKIDFTGQGSPPMLNAWFVWDREHQGETVMRFLDRDQDARQPNLFGY